MRIRRDLATARASICTGVDPIAVTGAGGFIGEAVCRRLVADGERVVGIDVAESAAARVTATGARFARADIADAASIAAALDGCAGVIHSAAIVSDWGSMAEFVRVNTRGTVNVLDALPARARAVVLASVAVWGYEFGADLAEQTPPKPCGNPYIDTKGATETLALLRGATVVRPGDVYGPGSVPWVLRPLETMKRGLFRLPGDGSGLMTPVYIDDLVDCIVRAYRTPSAAGRAYTCWDGHAVTARDFFSHHARWIGRERVDTIPAPLAVAGGLVQELIARVTGRPPLLSRSAITFISRRAVYPNTRAREELGWEPAVALEEGMARTEAWARAAGLV